MLSMDTIYIYRVGCREFEIIPNYEGSDKEFFHILESIHKGHYDGYKLYYDKEITDFQNENDLNTLQDAKDFIHNYIKINKDKEKKRTIKPISYEDWEKNYKI